MRRSTASGSISASAPAIRSRGAWSARSDGHHGRHQCVAGAQGRAVGALTTRGFRDALRIGYQERKKIFATEIIKPEALYSDIVELDERVLADGTIERPLDEAAVRLALEGLKAAGYGAVAIVLMHAYKYPAHEASVAKIARSIGFEQVSVSHEVSPLVKYVGRGDTTVIDAYLSPVLGRYVAQVSEELDVARSGARLMFMMSSGGLTAAEMFQGKDAILSGPAGGVVGLARTGEAAGFGRVIGFDMGGTSTDVAHFDGEYERAFETEVAGVRVRAPMMLIHTVAAGGGSVLHFDGERFRVGRIRPAPIPVPPVTATADLLPSPMPTSCSVSCCRNIFRRSSGRSRTCRSTWRPCVTVSSC